MRKAIFAALLLSAAAPIYGQTPQSAPVEQKTQPFTDEEKRKALEALQNIAGAFGDSKPAAQTEQKKDDHKTVADVADKALDISTKYIGQVVGVLEKAAPHVWAVMVRQQYAKAIGDLIGPIILILTLIIAATVTRRFWPEPDEDKARYSSDESQVRVLFTVALPIIGSIICAAFFSFRLADSAMYLINPEYYAIKDLIEMLLHPGSL
jgi:hypothetical protein